MPATAQALLPTTYDGNNDGIADIYQPETALSAELPWGIASAWIVADSNKPLGVKFHSINALTKDDVFEGGKNYTFPIGGVRIKVLNLGSFVPQ